MRRTLFARAKPLAVAALLLFAAPRARGEDPPLPADVAAMHPEGKWKIRKADLYVYLVRYESGQPNALAVLPEYMKLRLVEEKARQRKIGVSDDEVDRWFKQLEERMGKEGQAGSLDEMRKTFAMRKEELRRKGRQWVLMEKLARAILKEKDPSRKDEPVADDSVIFVIDTLYKEAKKETEGLPKGTVARIDGIDITEYEYGRALAAELPTEDVLRSLRGLILAEEVALLLGDRNPPSPEEIAGQRKWFLESEKNRIRRGVQSAPEEITDDMVEQVLKQRGLSLDLVLANPAFLAQARAIGHFEKALGDEDVRRYYDEHKGQYGEQLRVARILLGARAQNVPGVGRPIRTVDQGKKEANDLYERLKSGQDFGELAKQKSEDPEAIKRAGGVLPFWITAGNPAYEEMFKQAAQLDVNAISKPFFSQGRGFVIVKLLDRKPAPDFALLKEEIRRAAARDAYTIWRNDRARATKVNTELFEE